MVEQAPQTYPNSTDARDFSEALHDLTAMVGPQDTSYEDGVARLTAAWEVGTLSSEEAAAKEAELRARFPAE